MKCKRCKKRDTNIDSKTGFIYHWCYSCYRKALEEQKEYIYEFSLSGSGDMLEATKQAGNKAMIYLMNTKNTKDKMRKKSKRIPERKT